jgi:hypothetical protein
VVSVYPNPINGIIILSGLSSITNDKTVTLAIVDNTGKTALLKKVERKINSVTVDLSSLSNGVYYIIIHADKERIVKRFVKQ